MSFSPWWSHTQRPIIPWCAVKNRLKSRIIGASVQFTMQMLCWGLPYSILLFCISSSSRKTAATSCSTRCMMAMIRWCPDDCMYTQIDGRCGLLVVKCNLMIVYLCIWFYYFSYCILFHLRTNGRYTISFFFINLWALRFNWKSRWYHKSLLHKPPNWDINRQVDLYMICINIFMLRECTWCVLYVFLITLFGMENERIL